MKIAALLDAAGQAAVPQLGGSLYIYERQGSNWVAAQKLDFVPGEHASMDALRHYLEQVRDWLGDCQVMAAGATTGYYRVLFASLGVTLWPVRGNPEQFIDQIAHAYQQAATQPTATAEEEAPIRVSGVPNRPGHYRVDLRNAMGKPGAHTSKEVLLPFLVGNNFRQLEVLCDHVPKWFARVLPEYHLASKEENRDDFVRVSIYPLKGRAISSRSAFDFPDLTCHTALS